MNIKRIADALRALADAIEAEPPTHGDALLTITEAARHAATSRRVLNDAIRRGVLTAYGGQRDRAVRRADLDAWIESRRYTARHVIGPVDADIERRIRRMEIRRDLRKLGLGPVLDRPKPPSEER